MLWIKALHVIFMVTWFAGLFYLPRLFVYHASTGDKATQETFKVMERKLFAISTMGAVLTLVFGFWLLFGWLSAYVQLTWFWLKLLLVAALIGYHIWCWKLVRTFKNDANTRSHIWYRWFNEVPVIMLVGIVILVIVRPI